MAVSDATDNVHVNQTAQVIQPRASMSDQTPLAPLSTSLRTNQQSVQATAIQARSIKIDSSSGAITILSQNRPAVTIDSSGINLASAAITLDINGITLTGSGININSTGININNGTTVTDAGVVVNDGVNNRVLIGALPDGTFGMVVSKPGVDVSSVFS